MGDVWWQLCAVRLREGLKAAISTDCWLIKLCRDKIQNEADCPAFLMSLYTLTLGYIDSITWSEHEVKLNCFGVSLHSSEATQDPSLLCVKLCAVGNTIWSCGMVLWAEDSGNVRLSQAPCAEQAICVWCAGAGSQRSILNVVLLAAMVITGL